MAKEYLKEMYINCGCHDKQCGRLLIQFCGRNVLGVDFIPYKHKKVKFGVVISDSDLDKFRKEVIKQKEFDDNF